MSFTDSDRRSYMLGLKIMGDFGASIAVPVVAFVLAGKWLQNKFHFAPFGIIVGFVLAAALSTMLIRRKAAWYAAEYKTLETPHTKSLPLEDPDLENL